METWSLVPLHMFINILIIENLHIFPYFLSAEQKQMIRHALVFFDQTAAILEH